ncbi:SULTR4 [Symbiodinium sp. CCMP2456]|nr:SULTR4 [Symbiodinium sp. CCMP2456]
MSVSPKGAGYKALSADEGGAGKTWREVLLARLPILSWLPSYDKSFFLPDVTGGLTLGTMCLAQTLAHATIATTNPIQGPHTALLPPVVYALLGTSKHGSVSSGAMVAMIIANVLQPFPEEHHTELASLLALVAGICQILMGMFDLASAVRFLSQPTLSGFITGGAVLIIVSQLRNFFGYTEFPHESGPFGKVWACLRMLDQANWANVGLCSTLILFLVCSKRLKKVAKKNSKLSSFWAMVGYVVQVKEIIVVVAGIVFVKVTQKGTVAAVPIVGHIPRGLPPCQLPWNFDATRKLLEGPSDVLHSFLFSGLVLAFSAFLTSYSSFKRQAIACDYASCACWSFLVFAF